MKRLKNELKNEEMALVLLKKLKQSQTARPEVLPAAAGGMAASLGGGATITPTSKLLSRNDPKTLSRQNSANDMLNSEKLVSRNLFTAKPFYNVLSLSVQLFINLYYKYLYQQEII